MSRAQEKTEKPTERRKREARREGRQPRSQEVGVLVSLAGLLIAMRALAPAAADVLRLRTASILRSTATASLETPIGDHVVAMLVGGLLPFLGVASFLAVAGGVAQVGFTLAPAAAKPKLSHLSLKKGLNKFKPSVFGWELARTALKLGLLVAIVWEPVNRWMTRLGEPLGLGEALGVTGEQVWVLAMRATVLAAVIAAADYSVTRFRASREMKMSKQELKEEMKHSEGNPLIRSVRRRRAMEISRNRMIADVAGADVVVTNPTHLAVALRYHEGEAAPRVVAKGANRLAAKIRREAYRAGVTVLEDRPLARALYRKVKIGHFVPSALFEAVATVLAVAYRRRRRGRAFV